VPVLIRDSRIANDSDVSFEFVLPAEPFQ
jgi:hypothetical protein